MGKSKKIKYAQVRCWAGQLTELRKAFDILQRAHSGNTTCLEVTVKFRGGELEIGAAARAALIQSIVMDARETFRNIQPSLAADGVELPPGVFEPGLLPFEVAA